MTREERQAYDTRRAGRVGSNSVLHRMAFLDECPDCGAPVRRFRYVRSNYTAAPPDNNRRYWRCVKCTAQNFEHEHPCEARAIREELI